MQDLKKWFQKAGLNLKLEQEPIRSNQDIFQMSIGVRGKKNRREYFRIYHGDPENDIRVIDADGEKRQLILSVREPTREFNTFEFNEITGLYDKEVTRKTSSLTRKYLMGMDEAHLFISELPQEGAINKVNEAHRVLKPEYIIKIEKSNQNIRRQGEWFFVPVTEKEQKLIDINITFVKNKAPIVQIIRGHSHNADKMLIIEKNIYVTGKIRHVEHKTLKLRTWFRVFKNTEVQSRLGIVGWID